MTDTFCRKNVNSLLKVKNDCKLCGFEKSLVDLEMCRRFYRAISFVYCIKIMFCVFIQAFGLLVSLIYATLEVILVCCHIKVERY